MRKLQALRSLCRFHWRYWKRLPQCLEDLRVVVTIFEDDMTAEQRVSYDFLYGPTFIPRILDHKRRRQMLLWRLS